MLISITAWFAKRNVTSSLNLNRVQMEWYSSLCSMDVAICNDIKGCRSSRTEVLFTSIIWWHTCHTNTFCGSHYAGKCLLNFTNTTGYCYPNILISSAMKILFLYAILVCMIFSRLTDSQIPTTEVLQCIWGPQCSFINCWLAVFM